MPTTESATISGYSNLRKPLFVIYSCPIIRTTAPDSNMIILENRENASLMNIPPNAISVLSEEKIIQKARKIKTIAVNQVTF